MMYKLLTTELLIIFGILVICIITGCSDDDFTGYDEINLVATVPEDGGIISTTGELQLFFDSPPASVSVNGKAARIQGNTATVKIRRFPNLIPGTDRTLSIEWRNPDNSIAAAKTIRLTIVKRATKVEVVPRGGTIPTNQAFTLTFNQEVVAVWLNDTAAVGSGLVWKVSPPLWEGSGQTLNVKWVNQDGSTGTKRVGPYEVLHVHGEPPLITGGSVIDGVTDIDPAPLNQAGIEITFDEDITGSIKLTDEAGNDLNWIGDVAGSTARVTPIAGQELAHETTYKIEIDVKDGIGLRTQVTITFVTKPKE